MRKLTPLLQTILIVHISLLLGCAAIEIDSAIKKYNLNINHVRLGMPEKEVTEILGDPGSSSHVWPIERNKIEGIDITIIYYRVARNPDGLTTKEELSPFLFLNDRLEAIGWAAAQVRIQQLKEQPIARQRAELERPSVSRNGTCFVVRPDGAILTSHHIVADADTIVVRFADGRSVPGTVVHTVASIDLALLRVTVPTPAYLPLAAPRTAQVGQRVFTLGFPAAALLGEEPKFTDGTISALSGPGGDSALMQVSIPLQPGNSGGPVLSDQGEVLGIVASTVAVKTFFAVTGSLPQNVNWAVKADYAAPLFEPIDRPFRQIQTQQEAIEHAKQALCQVKVISKE